MVSLYSALVGNGFGIHFGTLFLYFKYASPNILTRSSSSYVAILSKSMMKQIQGIMETIDIEAKINPRYVSRILRYRG